MKNITAMVVLCLIAFSAAAQAQNNDGPFVHNLNRRYLDIDKSPEGLDEYKRFGMRLHRRAKALGLERVAATVTFKNAVSIDDALAIIKDYELKPRYLYAFSDKNDQVITHGFSFTSTRRERATAIVREQALDRDFLGMVSVVTIVPVAKLVALQDDPRVFLVDIVADENFTYNQGNGQYMHHLAWDLYQNKKKALRNQQ